MIDQESPEQLSPSLSDLRAQNRLQERPAFHDEAEGNFEQRRALTPEDRAEMDQKIARLSALLSGALVRWQLDGALNISLLKGDYIGVHKDVDLSVEPEDLEALEEHLHKQGYGLFLNSKHADPSKKTMMWVAASEFREAPHERSLAAIDAKGKICFDATLNFVDVHLVQRDGKGRPLGFQGIPLPEKWYEPKLFIYRGNELFLSHPAKVAYFKLHGDRAYDLVDLLALAETGALSLDDIHDIEHLIKQEEKDIKQKIQTVTQRVAPQITPGMTGENLYRLFSEAPEMVTLLKTSEEQKHFRGLMDSLASQTDSNVASIQHFFFEYYVQQKYVSLRQQNLERLRARVAEIQTIQKMESSL